MSLYSLSHEYATAMNKLMDSDLPDECIADTLEGMGGELVEKQQNVVAFFLNLEAEATMIREAENKMAARRHSIEGKAAHFREYLQSSMELCKITEIKAIDGSFCAKLLIDRDECVIVDDDLMLDPEYVTVKTTTAPDKSAIKKAIKAGKEVAGAHIQKNNRLEIK